MKIFLKSTVIATMLLWLSACSLISSTTQNKTIAVVNENESVKTSEGKVLLLPLMIGRKSDFIPANKAFDNDQIQSAYTSSWVNELGSNSEVYPVPKNVIDTIPMSWEAMKPLVTMIDDARKAREPIQNSALNSFFNALQKVTGKGIVAFVFVGEEEDCFESSKTLHYNAMLIDPDTLQAKWITNTTEKAVIPIPYDAAFQAALSNSWSELRANNNGAVR